MKGLLNNLGWLYIIQKSQVRKTLMKMVENIEKYQESISDDEVVVLHINSHIFEKYIKDVQQELRCDVVIDDSLENTEYMIEIMDIDWIS